MSNRKLFLECCGGESAQCTLLTTEESFKMAAASSRKDRSSPSDDAVYKVVLVGELGAGKSSIFMRFRDDIFHENYDGTRGMDHAVKAIDTGNEKISVSP